MWSYIAGGLKIKVIEYYKLPFGTKWSGPIIKGGLKLEGYKIGGLLYICICETAKELFYNKASSHYFYNDVTNTMDLFTQNF